MKISCSNSNSILLFCGLAVTATAAAAAVVPADNDSNNGDQDTSESNIHYDYNRHYKYATPGVYHYRMPEEYDPYVYSYAPRYKDVAPTQGEGHSHKHGHHDNDGGFDGFDAFLGPLGPLSNDDEDDDFIDADHPHHHGFVPIHQENHMDHGKGFAVGFDNVGPFHHVTGPFGPFGFYANFIHDL